VSTGRPLASVIVCTRNRAELLEGCLETLVAERPAVPWEIVVVDNASTDATAAVVERSREKASAERFEYVVEARPGLSAARNRGVEAARGDHLLFTDDDVLVEPGWVDGLCAGFEDPDVAAVAGRVEPEWPSPPPRWLAGRQTGLLALTDFGGEPRDLADGEVPVGASMAIRASALPAAAEPFDPRLGNRGGDRFAYEEHDLFVRLRRSGRLVYRPQAVVRHRIAPERMTWPSMRRAALHNGYGSRRAERLRLEPTPSRREAAVGLAREYAAARRARRRNGGGGDVEPEAAFEELRRWWEAGRRLEALLGDSGVARWLLGRLA
jgi:glycosyltransferase involved in cell wall biosynthesis